ncbi:hypothetical protein M6B38_166350 [Iris pallida]|uniref:Uncharacterized protein n=1 Tax=Iris pallida TaxID=29817 RepID=A0AAX6EW39_IRIPA|nr:hypothetical protein M6B38_166350 [Iris pallida]
MQIRPGRNCFFSSQVIAPPLEGKTVDHLSWIWKDACSLMQQIQSHGQRFVYKKSTSLQFCADHFGKGDLPRKTKQNDLGYAAIDVLYLTAWRNHIKDVSC